MFWVRHRVAPLLPVFQRERKTGILQGSQQVQERSLEKQETRIWLHINQGVEDVSKVKPGCILNIYI